jgi:hypothetical protein
MLCLGSHAVLSAANLAMTVNAWSIIFDYNDSFTLIALMIFVEFSVVCLVKHFVDKELFAFSIVAKPSKLSYAVGPLITFVWYASTLVSTMTLSYSPTELGPHVSSALFAWHIVKNAIITYHFLPLLDETKHLPWMSVQTGYLLHGAAAVVTVLALATWIMNMKDTFDRTRLWKRQTGKQMISEMWNDELVIWEAKHETKDEERAGWVKTMHPLYHNKQEVEKWVCEDLVGSFGGADVAAPKFLTDDFKQTVRSVFQWWSDGRSTANIDVALMQLPTYKEKEEVALKSAPSALAKMKSKLPTMSKNKVKPS